MCRPTMLVYFRPDCVGCCVGFVRRSFLGTFPLSVVFCRHPVAVPSESRFSIIHGPAARHGYPPGSLGATPPSVFANGVFFTDSFVDATTGKRVLRRIRRRSCLARSALSADSMDVPGKRTTSSSLGVFVLAAITFNIIYCIYSCTTQQYSHVLLVYKQVRRCAFA